MARKKKGKFIKAFFGLVVIAVACTYAWVLNEKRKTENDLAAIKKLGVPTSIEEYLQSIPREKKEESKLYKTAIDSWNKVPDQDKKYINEILDRSRNNLTKGLSQSDKKRVSDLLTSGATLFRRAANTDWSELSDKIGAVESTAASMNQQEALYTGIRLLVHAAEGKEPFNQAFNDIFYAGQIAGNSMRAPVGLAQISSALIQEKEQLEGWRKTLARGSDDPTTVEAAERVLNRMPPILKLPQLVQSTFVEGLWQHDNFRKFSDSLEAHAAKPDVSTQVKEALLASPPANVERKHLFVKDWRGFFESLPKDPEDWRGYEVAAQKAQQNSKTPEMLRGPETLGFVPRMIRNRMEAVAARRVAKTSLAILQQRLQLGRLPNSLPKLGNDSQDPFSGKPLVYKRTGKGFMVYSIGLDETDDGGVPKPTSQNGWKHDVVQSYP